MMQLFLLAFRSVFRNKRRSALNITALTLGMVVMFVGLGWVNGYHTYIYQSLMDFDTGSAQILNAGYEDQARRFPRITSYNVCYTKLLRRPLSLAQGE